MGQGRIGGDDLGAGDIDAGIGLLDHLHEDVRAVCRGQITIDRRVHDGVVDIPRPFLRLAIPARGVFLEPLVEAGIGPQRREKRALVVGRAAHPAPGDLLPFGDGIALRHLLLDSVRGAEEPLGIAAPFRRNGQHVLALRIMQRVIHARDHPGRIAERGVVGDVAHALAIDPDFAVVVQAVQILPARQRHKAGVGGRSPLCRKGGHAPLPAMAWQVISSLMRESASDATCTSVEHGKSPVKNSWRARQISLLSAMSVT